MHPLQKAGGCNLLASAFPIIDEFHSVMVRQSDLDISNYKGTRVLVAYSNSSPQPELSTLFNALSPRLFRFYRVITITKQSIFAINAEELSFMNEAIMVSGRAIATLILFILSIINVIRPVEIPLGRNRHFPLNLLTAPIIVIAILWASQCLGATTVGLTLPWRCLSNDVIDSTRDCVRGSNAYEILHVLIRASGTDGVKPYNILILFFSLAYMSITLDATGILKAAAYGVSNISGNNGTKFFIYFYLLITALSVFFGNDTMILSGTLFFVHYTDAVAVCIHFVQIAPLIYFCS